MPIATSEDTEVTTVDAAEEKGLDPYKYLASFANAPTKEIVEGWKAQVPGGSIKLFTSRDMKRVYIMRAIGGNELAQLQGRMNPAIPQEKFLLEMQIMVACHCCLWSSTSQLPNGALTDMVLRAAGAGLPATLHEIVALLSDYTDPVQLERLSVDL